jgi:large repetitive protein
VRGSGSTRLLLRTFFGAAVLASLAFSVVPTAGAATITSWRGGSASVPLIVTAAGTCPGTVIMINGTGFQTDGGPVSVTIGGVPSPQVIVGSDIALYAVVGPTAQSGPVVVTTAAGSVTAPGGNAQVYPCQATGTASAAPVISSVPSHLKANGKKVKVDGSNFVGTTGVTLGTEKLQYSIPSDNLMYVIIPKDAKAGATSLIVTNTKGSAKAPVTVAST